MVHCVRRASCQLRRVSGPLREESESPAEESQWSYFCTFRPAIGAQLQSPLLNSALQCRALGSAMPCLCPQSTIQCRPLKSAVPAPQKRCAMHALPECPPVPTPRKLYAMPAPPEPAPSQHSAESTPHERPL